MHENLYKNLVDVKILKDIIENHSMKDINGLAIWGAFFDEVPGIHLGHLHMMNKIWELRNSGIGMSICINEEPVIDSDRIKREVVERHAETTSTLLYVLQKLMTDVEMDVRIVMGGDETRRFQRESGENFGQIQEKLERARQEIVDAFAPLRVEGPNVSQSKVKTHRPTICEELKLDKNSFDELFELFVKRNKLHAQTRWASDFGATLCFMQERPKFLLVGRRHGYIWSLYRCMFQLAGEEPIPIIRIADFSDCIGENAMNNRDLENCVRLANSRDIIKGKLLKGSHLAQTPKPFALRDIFDKILLPQKSSININQQEFKSFQEIADVFRVEEMEVVAEAALEAIWQRYSSFIGVLPGLVLSKPKPTPRTVDNFTVLKYISKGSPVEEEILKLEDDSINCKPHYHRAIYNETLQAILDSTLKPRNLTSRSNTTDAIEIADAIEKIHDLIKATRGMDNLPYQVNRRHRDHFYHQINVGGLGAMLLDIQNDQGIALWKNIANNLKIQGNDDMKERRIKALWWITALLHDHAYSLSDALEIFPGLLTLGRHAAERALVKSSFEAHRALVRNMMSNDLNIEVFDPLYRTHVAKAYQNLQNLVENWLIYIPGLNQDVKEEILRSPGNHGVIGAINFLSYIMFRSLDNDEWRSFFQVVARAILVHHLPNLQEIRFDDHPLSFLLAFTDEIQEWSRIFLHEGKLEACLQRIELGDFMPQPEQPDTWKFMDFLEVCFPFDDEEKLESTGWDRERFHQDKRRGLDRLVPPGLGSTAFPREIKWHEAYVSTAKRR